MIELYDIMLSLRAHGWTRNLDDDNSICNKTKDNFTESFRFILPGYNLRPLEFSGAIGLSKLKNFKFVKQRKKIMRYLKHYLIMMTDSFYKNWIKFMVWFFFNFS